MGDNVVTYETFRKFQRKERDSENLQELPEDFFQSCAEWLKRKAKAYEETKDLMIQREIENVLGIIKDILDRRERKLLLLAMHTVRSNAVPKNLHPYEEKYFDSVVENLKKMREEILEAIKGEAEQKEAEGKSPKVQEQEKTEVEETQESKEEKESVEVQKPEEEPKKEENLQEKSEISEKEKLPETKQEKSVKPEEVLPKIVEPPGYKLIRITAEIPKFLGTDGKAYGPFKPNDMVTLEEEIAKLVVERGKAEFTVK